MPAVARRRLKVHEVGGLLQLAPIVQAVPGHPGRADPAAGRPHDRRRRRLLGRLFGRARPERRSGAGAPASGRRRRASFAVPKLRGQLAGREERVAPLVQRDELGQQLGAQAVGVAVDGVDAQPSWRCSSGVRGRTVAGRSRFPPGARPRRRRTCAVHWPRAARRRPGWEQAPRPGITPSGACRRGRRSRSAAPMASASKPAAIAGSPKRHGPHWPAPAGEVARARPRSRRCRTVGGQRGEHTGAEGGTCRREAGPFETQASRRGRPRPTSRRSRRSGPPARRPGRRTSPSRVPRADVDNVHPWGFRRSPCAG